MTPELHESQGAGIEQNQPVEQQAVGLLRNVLHYNWKNFEAEGLTQQQVLQFFEDTIFPTIHDAYCTELPDANRTQLESRLNQKIEVIRKLASGEDLTSIAESIGKKSSTLDRDVKNLLTVLRRPSSKFSYEELRGIFWESFPDVQLRGTISGARSVIATGRLAVRGVENGTKKPAPHTRPNRKSQSWQKTGQTPDQPRRIMTPRVREMSSSAQTTTHGESSRSIEKDAVGMYLDEIAKHPLLDAAGEVELSKRIEAGLYAANLLTKEEFDLANKEELEWLAEDAENATRDFINSNLRLVVSIARKYGRAQMPLSDLIQEGNTGLIRAVEKFDYTKGYKFSTYATWWVRQAITRGIAQQARVVRLPVHVHEELNQVGSARRTLERILGREPQPEEIAGELGFETERVLDLLAWGRDHVSLDTPLGDEGNQTLKDVIDDQLIVGAEATVLLSEDKERLEDLIATTLDERKADIVRSRYGLASGKQERLAEIGVRHGISAERVRQLEREALQQLRRRADPDLAS